MPGKGLVGDSRAMATVVFAILMAIIVAVAVFITERHDYLNSDFFTFWLSGHFLGSGLDPYDPARWREGHVAFGSTNFVESTFLYPILMAVAFLPFGALPVKLSFTLWMIFSISAVLIAVVVAMTAQDGILRWKYLAAFIPPVFLFYPVLVGLNYAQNHGLLLLILALSLYLWDRGRWFWGGAVLSLLIVKPQLALPVMALIGCWLLAKRSWSAFAGIAAGGLLFAGLSLLLSPGWIGRWLAVSTGKLSTSVGDSATAWGIARTTCGVFGPCMMTIGSILVIALLALWFFMLPKLTMLRAVEAGGIAVMFALLLPPYLITYDMTLLVLPMIGYAMGLERRGTAALWVALFPFGMALLSMIVVVLFSYFWRPYGLSGMGGHTIITLVLLAFNAKALLGKHPGRLPLPEADRRASSI